MRHLKTFLIPMLLALVVGCAQLGVPTPETFNQKLAVSVAAVTSVRQTTAALLTAGKITATDAKNIEAQADNARAGLDIARAEPDLGNATTKLQAIQATLTALQQYLITKQGK